LWPSGLAAVERNPRNTLRNLSYTSKKRFLIEKERSDWNVKILTQTKAGPASFRPGLSSSCPEVESNRDERACSVLRHHLDTEPRQDSCQARFYDWPYSLLTGFLEAMLEPRSPAISTGYIFAEQSTSCLDVVSALAADRVLARKYGPSVSHRTEATVMKKIGP
jgi:hypothetical protein